MATKDTSYKFIVKQMTYLGNVDWVNCGLRKFEFREGSHVNSGPASIVLSDLNKYIIESNDLFSFYSSPCPVQPEAQRW